MGITFVVDGAGDSVGDAVSLDGVWVKIGTEGPDNGICDAMGVTFVVDGAGDSVGDAVKWMESEWYLEQKILTMVSVKQWALLLL
jgi:hypothetical protein